MQKTLRFLLLTTLPLAALHCEAPADPEPNPESPDSPPDTGPDDPAPVSGCEAAPAGPGDGSCSIEPGSGDDLLIFGTVLAPDQIFEGGSVLIDESGTITCVGCDCANQTQTATRLLCGDAVISPGLINAHDHLGWMGDQPYVADNPSLRYEHRHDWRKGDRADNEPKVSTRGNASKEEKIWGELRFVLSGATSINGSGVSAGLLRNLDRSSGLEGLQLQPVEYETFPLGDSNGSTRSSGCDYPKPMDPADAISQSAFTPHVAEGINQEARNEFLCLSRSTDGAVDALNSNTAVIHGIGLSPLEVQIMAAEGMKLIWSPRSNISLYGDTAQVTLYQQLGVPIALGTDWVPSGSMNILRELQCAAYLDSEHFGGALGEESLWRMVTDHAAKALGASDQLGTLRVGLVADISIFRAKDLGPHASIVYASPADVMLVLRGGEVLSGDAALVEALEPGCDPLDVCGTGKQICLSREIQLNLGALEAAVSNAYPLFFCGEPTAEPSCVPLRGPGESVAGSSVYTDLPGLDDGDGDGISDGVDNCPAIFNPIRPLDQGRQGDYDEDGVGDVCDTCPLDPDTDQCTRYEADDPDRDGIKDFEDNCPDTANADQADSDGDERGDVCDPCPEEANPGAQGCTVPIQAIQDETHPIYQGEGARVAIECVVSAVKSLSERAKGFWCQDPAGGPYSGVMVFTADQTPSVQVNDQVKVDGTVTEYFSLTELVNPTVTILGQTSAIEPAVVNPQDIATGGSQAEAYEGVLVQVRDVSVTVENADLDPSAEEPKDYDEFEVTGDLRIDDYIVDGGASEGSLDNTFPVGTTFQSITGIAHFSYDNAKLLPRTLDDLER